MSVTESILGLRPSTRHPNGSVIPEGWSGRGGLPQGSWRCQHSVRLAKQEDGQQIGMIGMEFLCMMRKEVLSAVKAARAGSQCKGIHLWVQLSEIKL